MESWHRIWDLDPLHWIADVDGAGGLFFVDAWLVILGGLFGLVALVGFYDALRGAGPVTIFGPILGAVGMTLVTISHLIPIGMAYELVPGYVDGSAATRSLLGPLSSFIEGITFIGFLGFFLFMASMGVALLRRGQRSSAAALA